MFCQRSKLINATDNGGRQRKTRTTAGSPPTNQHGSARTTILLPIIINPLHPLGSAVHKQQQYNDSVV